MRGPLGDYAVVFLYRNVNSGSNEDSWWGHYTPWDNSHVNRNKGAIRPAKVDTGQPWDTWTTDATASRRAGTWKVRDTMSRIADGTSNVFIVGEKHVRAGEFGKCCDGNNADGSYMFSDGGWREYQVARNIRFRLSKGPVGQRTPGRALAGLRQLASGHLPLPASRWFGLCGGRQHFPPGPPLSGPRFGRQSHPAVRVVIACGGLDL